MEALSSFLKKEGMDTLNINYPSRKKSLEELTALLWKRIGAQKLTPPCHFVGHSLGGLLIRCLLHTYTPSNCGRVVQISPPNQGSVLVDKLKPYTLYKILFGPAGQQLSTNQSSIRSLLGPVSYPLGIIAGNVCKNPLISSIMGGPSDGRVLVQHTTLAGMTDHLVLPFHHSVLPYMPIVHQQTAHFLKHGTFMHHEVLGLSPRNRRDFL